MKLLNGTKKIVFLLFLFVSSVSYVNAASGGNSDLLARVWVNEASDLLASVLNGGDGVPEDNYKYASEALYTAMEFCPPSSDSLYLQAFILSRKGYKYGGFDFSAGSQKKNFNPEESPLNRAFTLVSGAIEKRKLTSVSIPFADYALLYSSLALRLKKYRILLDAYYEWPEGEKLNPLLLYAASRAALYLGQYEMASDLAMKGEALSTPGDNIKKLDPEFDWDLKIAFRAVSFAAGNDFSIYTINAAWNQWGASLENALWPWILSGNFTSEGLMKIMPLLSSGKKQILDILLGNKPYYEFSESLSGLPEDADSDFALIKRLYGIKSALMQDNAYSLYRKKTVTSDCLKNKETNVPAFSFADGFTGSLTADYNYDGYPEEVITFINGRLDSWNTDSNQDGLYEWNITFSTAEPYNPLDVKYGNGKLSITYDEKSYPSIYSVFWKNGNTSVTVKFHPGGFLWDPVENCGIFNIPDPPVWQEEKFWHGAKSVNIYVSDLPDGTSGAVKTFLSNGLPIKAIEKHFESGDAGKVLWIREILFDNGVPVAGRRTYHPYSVNPEWEIYERYSGGRITGIAFDADVDGNPEYYSDWAESLEKKSQYWDTDSDGFIDISRFLPPEIEYVENYEITGADVSDLIPWKASDWAPWE